MRIMKRRVFVLGIDGGTFDILLPLAERGHMPNLARVLKHGSRSNLTSTFSFLTAPAWTSFMTGKNPGKHDVFDFVRPYRKELAVEFNNYRSIRSRTIWNILSEKDFRVCAINVPMMYPAPEVNGMVISGLGAPGLVEKSFFPRDLYSSLERELGQYMIDVPLEKYGPRDVDSFLEDLLECTRIRKKYINNLLDRDEWDLFMAVLAGADRIQHKLWTMLTDLLSGGTNGDDTSSRILGYFKILDEIIGDLDRRLGENDILILMSDHGFGSMDHELTINRWLNEHGYFTPSRGRLLLKRAMSAIRELQRRSLARFSPKALERKTRDTIKRTETARKPRMDFINWSKTRAFSSTRTQQGITINLKGREPFGIVEPGEEYETLRDEIISSLRDLKDPVSGEKMNNLVHRREEVYFGPYIENAPDIVYLFDGGRIIATHQFKNELFTPTDWKTGDGMHRREGIFLAKGRMVVEDQQMKANSITDVAPTILYHLGVEIPDDFDGSVIDGIYKREFLSKHEITFEEARVHIENGEDSVYTEKDKKAIEDQLRGIGYME
ncbi:MAG: alkaline phosphatase family protein [Candidatus Glassbacteria bacterium]